MRDNHLKIINLNTDDKMSKSFNYTNEISKILK